jgi:DNA-binding NtrC family response regulator
MTKKHFTTSNFSTTDARAPLEPPLSDEQALFIMAELDLLPPCPDEEEALRDFDEHWPAIRSAIEQRLPAELQSTSFSARHGFTAGWHGEAASEGICVLRVGQPDGAPREIVSTVSSAIGELNRFATCAMTSVYVAQADGFVLAGCAHWNPPPEGDEFSFDASTYAAWSARTNQMMIVEPRDVSRSDCMISVRSGDQVIRLERGGMPELEERILPDPHVLYLPLGRLERCAALARCVRSGPFASAVVEEILKRRSLLSELVISCLSSHFGEARYSFRARDDDDQLLSELLERATAILNADPSRSGIYIREPHWKLTRYALRTAAPNSRLKQEYKWSTSKEATAEEQAHRPPSLRVPISSATEWVLRHGELLWSGNVARDLERSQHWRSVGLSGKHFENDQERTRAYCGIPLLVEGHVVGALVLKSPDVNPWSPIDVWNVGCLANDTMVRRRLIESRRIVTNTIMASERAAVVTDRRGYIKEVNEAAVRTVGSAVLAAKGGGAHAVQVFYGGNLELARHVKDALVESRGQAVRNHYTYLFREAASDNSLPIPVRLAACQSISSRGRHEESVGFFESLLAEPGNEVKPFGEPDHAVLTADKAMIRVLKAAEDARVRRGVLLIGPRGSGKGFVAKHIHEPLSVGQFVRVHCASHDEEGLLEELFGWVSGWKKDLPAKRGAFHKAQGGTLFLDALDKVPLHVQRRLLRVLEGGDAVPMGGASGERIAFRFVAATRCRREALRDRKRFAPELMEWLRDPLVIPAFQERRSDILLMAVAYLEAFKTRARRNRERAPAGFESSAVEMLWRYSWPGGLHELKVLVEEACHQWQKWNRSSLVGWEHLSDEMVRSSLKQPFARSLPALEIADIEKALQNLAAARKKMKEKPLQDEVLVKNVLAALAQHSNDPGAVQNGSTRLAIADKIAEELKVGREKVAAIVTAVADGACSRKLG